MSEVSAIISAYFCRDWIHARINDLLAQSASIKLIFVCQKGSEEEKIIWDRHKEMDFAIVTTPDIPTIYKSWNLAIKASHSDKILVANSDDKFTSKYAVHAMSQALDDNPGIDLVYVDSVVVKEQRGVPVSYMDLADPDVDLIDGCYIGNCPMWRRSLHDQFGYFDEKFVVAGDWEFWLRLQRGGVKFHHIKERLGEFWNHTDNIEFKYNYRLIWEQALVRRKYAKLQ